MGLLAVVGAAPAGVPGGEGGALVASRYVRSEAGREVLRNGPGDAGADRAAIELGDAHDFGGGTGEEDFIGSIEIVAVEGQLFSGVACFPRQLQHGVAGDAAQDPGVRGRRAHDAAGDDEQIHAARLRHVPGRVQHDHFVHRRGDALELRQDVGQIVQRLHAGGEALPVVDRRGGRDGDEPLLIALGAPQSDRIGDAKDRRLRALARIEPQVADPAGDHQPDVRFLDPALSDAFLDDAPQLGLGQRDVEPDRLGGRVQPVEVFGEPEDAAAVRADPLENAVAIEEAVVEYGNDRGRAVVTLAADPYNGGHWSKSASNALP